MKTKRHPLKHSTLLLGAIAVATAAQASSDYGPAIWNPAYPGHWYTSGYGHKFHVVHDMEGYYLSTISYFQRSTTSASVHYCVNGLQDTGSDIPPVKSPKWFPRLITPGTCSVGTLSALA